MYPQRVWWSTRCQWCSWTDDDKTFFLSLSLLLQIIEFDLLYTGGEGVDVDHFNIRVYTRLRILGWFKWPNDDKFGGCVICIVVADLSPAAQINPVGIRV